LAGPECPVNLQGNEIKKAPWRGKESSQKSIFATDMLINPRKYGGIIQNLRLGLNRSGPRRAHYLYSMTPCAKYGIYASRRTDGKKLLRKSSPMLKCVLKSKKAR